LWRYGNDDEIKIHAHKDNKHSLTMTMTKTESKREKKEQCTSQDIKIVKSKKVKKTNNEKKNICSKPRKYGFFHFFFREGW